MATILEFRSGARQSPLRARNLLDACEIVFFPGVRYEYNAAPPMPAPAKPRRKSKRDKLELKD